jgi:membrane protein DedA with SNARE-associated domain
MSSPQLPGVFASLAPVLDRHGYLAVAGFVLLEDFGVPVPGETVLIAAAVYAGAGKLNVVLVGVLALIAAVVGDNIGYGLGRWGGRELVLRFGRYVLLTEKRLDAAHRWFERHGGKVVVVARFVEGLRQANGWIAGITGMHWLRFAIFNALGAVLWVATWLTVGYVSGRHIDTVYSAITRYAIYIGIGVAVALLVLIIRHVLRRRRENGASDGEDRTDEPRSRVAGSS